MGRHKKKNNRETGAVLDTSPSKSPRAAHSDPITQTPTTAESASELFVRVRAEQKFAAAKKKAEAEKITRLSQQSTLSGNALIARETAERDALRIRMRSENPETVKAARALVREALNRVIYAEEERKAEKNLIRTQELMDRHAISDHETKEHLSILSKFEKKPSVLTPEQQQRIAERNQDATAELRRRTKAAKAQRMGLFSHPKPTAPSSPTFDMVGAEEAQQSAASKPKRWW